MARKPPTLTTRDHADPFQAVPTVGMMNIAAMVALTLLIFAEKSLPTGTLIGRLAGAALIAYGAMVIFVPHALPGMTM